MDVNFANKILNQLYENANGYDVSRKSRHNKKNWYIGHTYGEITPKGWQRILALVKPRKGAIFYDLGSGAGKVIYLTSMLGYFSQLVGIEILRELYETSLSLLPVYRKLINYEKISKQNIQFIHGDFKEIDITNADVIFMNATCMEYEFTTSFIQKLEKLKAGAKIVTNTIFIQSNHFMINNIGLIPFSWGEEEVYIHTKRM